MTRKHKNGVDLTIALLHALTGQNARDIGHFVKFFGYSPAEALRCATAIGGELMGQKGELGVVKEGALEIDFAWVTRGGGDPVAEMRRFGDRMLAIQVKDTYGPEVTAEGGWAAMGDGVVDWRTLWPMFKATPADHLVVEHDEPADWRPTADRSIRFLRSLDRGSAS